VGGGREGGRGETRACRDHVSSHPEEGRGKRGGEKERKGREGEGSGRMRRERDGLFGKPCEGEREGGREGTNTRLTWAAGPCAGPATAENAAEGVGRRRGGGEVHSLGIRRR